MPRIEHHRHKCIGCNSCVENAPANWHMSQKDGKSCLKGAKKRGEVFVTKITPAELEENEKAAQDCPVNIIRVYK